MSGQITQSCCQAFPGSAAGSISIVLFSHPFFNCGACVFLNKTVYSAKGLIPIAIHMDGAEFYSNSEYMVWSVGSILVENDHVFDTKFVVCCIPHESMQSNDVFWFVGNNFFLFLNMPVPQFSGPYTISFCNSFWCR